MQVVVFHYLLLEIKSSWRFIWLYFIRQRLLLTWGMIISHTSFSVWPTVKRKLYSKMLIVNSDPVFFPNYLVLQCLNISVTVLFSSRNNWMQLNCTLSHFTVWINFRLSSVISIYFVIWPLSDNYSRHNKSFVVFTINNDLHICDIAYDSGTPAVE